jgi:hypothetical protein
MKKIYLLLVSVLVSLSAMAIPDYGLWCNGRALLENGTALEGEISYDLKFEVVRVKVNGITSAYSAESIAYFELYDPMKQIHRKYVSVDSPVYPDYQRKTFFEIISHGELAMLRKSEYVRRPRLTEDMRAPHIYLNAVCKHTYFLHEEKSGLTEINDFREDILPRMDRYEEEVTDYIKRCKLKLKKLPEQVRVVNLYNMLHANENKLATSSPEKHKEVTYNFH